VQASQLQSIINDGQVEALFDRDNADRICKLDRCASGGKVADPTGIAFAPLCSDGDGVCRASVFLLLIEGERNATDATNRWARNHKTKAHNNKPVLGSIV
jgi:hypothetical protein